MKVTRDKTENSQAFLTIEVEPAEMEESLKKAYQRLVQRIKVPGFRKGKAPREVFERYIGKEGLLDDALKHMIPHTCEDAIKEQEIEAFAQPHVDIVQNEPLIFTAVVPLPPTVKLDDYRRLRLEPEPVKSGEDEVNAVLEQQRHQHATLEPVERPLDYDDVAVLDVEGDIEDKPFVRESGLSYKIRRDQNLPLPGFAEQLLGMKGDEEKEFKLQIPEDYARSEVAGKEASLKVKVVEAKEEKLPEMNDALAAEIDPEVKTLDSLREKIAVELKQRAEEKAKVDYEDKVIDAVVELAEVEYPPVMVEMEIDHLLEQQARRWQMAGGNIEQYLASLQQSGEAIREEMRPAAIKMVMRSLVLGKVAEEEKTEITDDEIEAEIERMIGNVNNADEKKEEMAKFLNTPQAREPIRQSLFSQKVVQQLVEIAKGSKLSEAEPKEEKK